MKMISVYDSFLRKIISIVCLFFIKEPIAIAVHIDRGRLSTKRRKYSRPSKRKSVYLWEFLFGLLEDDECASVISWNNKLEGIFTLKNANELAKLWGTVKNKPNMDKYKLFRSMRNYYNTGILKKVFFFKTRSTGDSLKFDT
jgi:hypothetical protein